MEKVKSITFLFIELLVSYLSIKVLKLGKISEHLGRKSLVISTMRASLKECNPNESKTF
jgi:hypothetical protein